jgi:xylulokinase
MKEFLIGVDLGTQGTKAALFSSNGRCLASAFLPSKLIRKGPGRVEEDADRQAASVARGIRDCLEKSKIDPRAVCGVAIAGQMAGVVGIDENGRAITPYDSWLDTRCAPQIKQMRELAGAEIIRKTGGPASFNHGPKILWWKKNHPGVYRAVRAFVQPGAYAAMRLCGSKSAYIDGTYLHFSGFADNRRNRWDGDLCAAFKVDMDKMPRIASSREVIGKVAAGSRSGLLAGTPVVAGCGDTAASFLACGATRPKVCVDVAGTASVFAATTAKFLPDVRSGTLSCGQSVVPGLWHPYAYINGGGMNLEWFKESIVRMSLDDLNKQAASLSPTAADPMFVPHLAGRVSPAWPELRGSWAGLTWTHRSAHLYRAMLEGVALEYAVYRDVLRKLDPSFVMDEMRITGGGERSTLWNKIKASALGCPVVQMSRPEGGPMGCALLAGAGVGLFQDLDAAAQRWVGRGSVTQPVRRETAHYAARLARYRRLLEHLNQWSES